MASIKKSGSGKKYWLAALVVLALFCVWNFYFKESARKPPMSMSLPPVRVAEAIIQNVPHYLNGLGTVLPSSDVLVRSRVEGQLLRLHFQDGQRVKAGDLLAEIDPRPFQAALNQARGNLEKDKAQLENARRDLARYEKLSKGDFIAEQQYENQKALVRQYQGTVEADKAAVDSAALQVEYSRVTAPVSGRLGLRAVDVGNQVKPADSEGIVRITETDPCDVLFTLPESQVSIVAQALRKREQNPDEPPLVAEAWDRENKKLLATGVLLSLDNQIDSATGTIKLKARFANKDNALFPNQFVNVRLLAQIIKNAVTVPSAAVQLGAKGSYCYIIKSASENGKKTDTVIFREVIPGLVSEGIEIIDKGIAAGELVVVDGVDRLRNDMQVNIAATMQTPHLEGQNEPAPAVP